MEINHSLNTKTALEHLIFLNNKNVVIVCRDLQITPQQFTDWIKSRRPIPAERLTQLSGYFNIPGDVLADDNRYAKRLSNLSNIEIEIMVVKSQLKPDNSDAEREELNYRIERLNAEREKQIRIARLAALLEQDDRNILNRIDTFLDEMEGK